MVNAVPIPGIDSFAQGLTPVHCHTSSSSTASPLPRSRRRPAGPGQQTGPHRRITAKAIGPSKPFFFKKNPVPAKRRLCFMGRVSPCAKQRLSLLTVPKKKKKTLAPNRTVATLTRRGFASPLPQLPSPATTGFSFPAIARDRRDHEDTDWPAMEHSTDQEEHPIQQQHHAQSSSNGCSSSATCNPMRLPSTMPSCFRSSPSGPPPTRVHHVWPGKNVSIIQIY